MVIGLTEGSSIHPFFGRTEEFPVNKRKVEFTDVFPISEQQLVGDVFLLV